MRATHCLSAAILTLGVCCSTIEAQGKCETWINVLFRAYPDSPWSYIQVSDNDELPLQAGVEYAVEMMSDCSSLHYVVWQNDLLIGSASTQAFYPPCCTGLIWPVTDTGSYSFVAWAQGSDALNVRFVQSSELSSVSFRFSGVWLSGTMSDEYTYARMRTSLSESQLVPFNEPFTEMGWLDETSGGETMTDAVRVDRYADLVDWVRLELREPQEPYALRFAANLLLTQSGQLLSSTGDHILTMDVPPGHYAIKLRHRNHLPITIAPFYFPGNSFHFDLSGEDLPISSGATRLPIGWNKWAMRAGNAHVSPGEQRISYSGPENDRDAILQRIGGINSTATISGYYNEDIDMDGVVKYTGLDNDRDLILQAIGGTDPVAVVSE